MCIFLGNPRGMHAAWSKFIRVQNRGMENIGCEWQELPSAKNDFQGHMMEQVEKEREMLGEHNNGKYTYRVDVQWWKNSQSNIYVQRAMLEENNWDPRFSLCQHSR